MLSDEIKALIAKQFSFALTPGQQRAALLLSHFICTPKADAACILRGYAGTGKTSLVGALVKVMRMLKREVVLLAPTGRAAKVFSHHAGEAAKEKAPDFPWAITNCAMRSSSLTRLPC